MSNGKARWSQFLQLWLHTQVRLCAYSDLRGIPVGVGTPYFRLNSRCHALIFKAIRSVSFSLCYLLLLFFPAFFMLKRITGGNPRR